MLQPTRPNRPIVSHTDRSRQTQPHELRTQHFSLGHHIRYTPRHPRQTHLYCSQEGERFVAPVEHVQQVDLCRRGKENGVRPRVQRAREAVRRTYLCHRSPPIASSDSAPCSSPRNAMPLLLTRYRNKRSLSCVLSPQNIQQAPLLCVIARKHRPSATFPECSRPIYRASAISTVCRRPQTPSKAIPQVRRRAHTPRHKSFRSVQDDRASPPTPHCGGETKDTHLRMQTRNRNMAHSFRRECEP